MLTFFLVVFCVHSWTSRTGGFGDKIDFYFVFFFYSFDSYAVDVFPMKNKIRKTEKNVWKNRNLFCWQRTSRFLFWNISVQMKFAISIRDVFFRIVTSVVFISIRRNFSWWFPICLHREMRVHLFKFNQKKTFFFFFICFGWIFLMFC